MHRDLGHIGPCRPARQLDARRWQLATCFAELETSFRGGTAVVLRSKSPPMIRQEIYAMLCCYQAIRTLISHAADDAGLGSLRISFTAARQAIRSCISDSRCFPLTSLTNSPPTWPPRSPGHRHLIPARPGRCYERKTKRPGAATRPTSMARPPAYAPDEGRLLADAGARLT
jgi:hypothetical protein